MISDKSTYRHVCLDHEVSRIQNSVQVSFCREGVWSREIAAPRIQVVSVLTLNSGRLSPAEKHIRTNQAENCWATGLTAATQTRVIW